MGVEKYAWICFLNAKPIWISVDNDGDHPEKPNALGVFDQWIRFRLADQLAFGHTETLITIRTSLDGWKNVSPAMEGQGSFHHSIVFQINV